ncbi:MAG: glycosyltransferase family 25 protein [Saprospiraceae bacterium]|nr:glycosyltransferase family 25 protein [Saprospiraceae bacterium]MBK9630813.1 glycosyltransferase family 25 protein [Saprospiraceae bacterium]
MKTFIIHVGTATERMKHMQVQLKDKNLDTEFILRGNKEDLSDEIMEKYFTGELKYVSNGTSCVYKHLLAYTEIIKHQIEIALVLEDDIFFHSNFMASLSKITAEIKRDQLSNFVISLEDSSLTFVPRSEFVADKMLYKKLHGRMAGAYLIDLIGAQTILEEVKKNKCHFPIDWFHNYLSEKAKINILWLYKPVATQGSLEGSIKSTLDSKAFSKLKVISFRLQRIYKKLLYWFR